MTDIPIPEFVRRLEENLASFDAEVAYQLSIEGERADLWGEIDVNVEDLRSLLADRAAQAERMARLEEARIAAHRNFIDAWEALPGGYYNVRDVDTWLILTMKPAVERARRALSQGGSEPS